MTAFVFAHGAGGHKDDRGMLALSGVLEACGIEPVRFNFAYQELGSRRIDAMPVLKAAMREAIAGVRDRPLFIGGRSMGGRVATLLAAEGLECDGLILFAYPLHPAGQPEKLRDAHLAQIRAPVLCLNGTRDALCRRELMEKAMENTRGWTVHWLEGANHSFRVPKGSGRTEADVLEEVREAISRWQAAVLP